AYLLTPGIAEKQKAKYGVYPNNWKETLRGCVSDRPLLWGGRTQIKRRLLNSQARGNWQPALSPQRAFVPPGTVYSFGKNLPKDKLLLPDSNNDDLETFRQLNYGKLLWGKIK
ncbi:MAG: CRISPR-associated protein, partial [Moorea sp. SIO3C2]|nr:CRISPR-associated protein [Moorena sp. SIO3C2]